MWKTERKRLLWRLRRRWEDNIKIDLQEVRWGRNGMNWIDLAQDRDRWRALVKAVTNLRVLFHSHNPRSSCHSCCSIHFLVAFPVLPFTTVFQVRPHVYKQWSTSLSLLTSYVPDAVLFTPTRCFRSSQIKRTGLIPDRTACQQCLATATTLWNKLCYCFSKLLRCHKTAPTTLLRKMARFPQISLFEFEVGSFVLLCVTIRGIINLWYGIRFRNMK